MIHYDILCQSPGTPEALEHLSKMSVDMKVSTLMMVAPGPERDLGIKITLAASEFLNSGKNVYRVGPRLHRMFQGMSLNKITKEEMSLPYKGFYVEVRDSTIPVWGGKHTLWHDLKGIYVYYIPEGVAHSKGRSVGECWGVIMWGGPNDKSVDAQDDAVYQLTIALDEAFENGLETYIKNITAEKAEDASGPDYLPTDQKVFNQRNKSIMSAIRIVFNTVLYVTSCNPEMRVSQDTLDREELEKALGRAKSSKKKVKLARRLEKKSVCYIRDLAPSLESAPKEASVSTEGIAEHKVAAHWHRYWVGRNHEKYAEGVLENEKGRRLVRIFVEEYNRGTDLAGRIVSRTYVVE